LWLVTVAVGVAGAWIVFDPAEYEGEFLSWYPLFAVPFGLLLGAAVIATLRAAGHRAPIPLVLVASVIFGLMLYAVPGFLGTQPAQQAAGEECSTEEVALFEGLSLYDDLDQKPTGTQFGSCYVVYTIDGTGQQAWVDLSQSLVDNGWKHASRPDWMSRPSGDPYRPYRVLYRTASRDT
jgi:hypothetical protein